MNLRMALAADSAGMGIWDWDLNESRVICDERMCRLYGIEPGEGDPNWWNIIHCDDRRRLRREYRRAANGEQDLNAEFRIVRPDGEVRILKGSAVVVRDEDGRPIRMTGINYDVTEQRRMEKALRESEEVYRAAFRTSPDSININRASDGLYVDINEGFSRLTGYSREEVIGKTSVEIGIWAEPARTRADDRGPAGTGDGQESRSEIPSQGRQHHHRPHVGASAESEGRAAHSVDSPATSANCGKPRSGSIKPRRWRSSAS